jgi:hypothetical protein
MVQKIVSAGAEGKPDAFANWNGLVERRVDVGKAGPRKEFRGTFPKLFWVAAGANSSAVRQGVPVAARPQEASAVDPVTSASTLPSKLYSSEAA